MKLEVGKVYELISNIWNQGEILMLESVESFFDFALLETSYFDHLFEGDLFLIIEENKNFIKILTNTSIGWVNVDEIQLFKEIK